MSDISKKIFSIDPEPDEEPIALVPTLTEDDASPEDEATPSDKKNDRSRSDVSAEDNAGGPDGQPVLRTVVEMPTPIFRPIIELVKPSQDDQNDDSVTQMTMDQIVPSSEDLVPIRTSSPQVSEPDQTRAHSTQKKVQLGWICPVLAILTAIAVGTLAYAYVQDVDVISPLGLAGLVMATFVSTVTILVLWLTMRTLGQTQERSLQLADVAQRLTHADESVTSDIESMSSAIRRELAQVDNRMAQSRVELDTLVAQISQQSADMDGKTRLMTERSETIARAMMDHHNAFTDLSSTFESQMSALAETVDRHRGQLADVSQSTVQQVDAAMEGIDRATQQTADRGSALAEAVNAANQVFSDAEAQLSGMADTISERAAELDRVYDRQAEHLSSLTGRLTNETTTVETALANQTQQLSAIDAQIEITESRLTELLDHARGLQAQLNGRLSDIDSTLSEADSRSKAFTADIADRVSDSVAQTRRELSIMEGELRALQSRMDGAKDMDLGLDVPKTKTPPSSGRLHLKPLESDFPPVEPDDLVIPEMDNDQTLDLIEPLDLPSDTIVDKNPTSTQSDPDLIRRPGEQAPSGRVFGRTKKDDQEKEDWRWRDMLGAMDPIVKAPSKNPPPKTTVTSKDSASSKHSGSGIDRPPPGVPLSPPPPAPKLPDGSDVVARLCEVQLAPSAIVDQGTIIEATDARRSGGEAAQCEAVFTRLNSPIIHLRGVLAADLEFRLRAEGFRRNFDAHLQNQRDQTKIRAELGTASGRAYLLCAAALQTS